MICGDLGYVNHAGRPCGQVIGRGVGGCIHHDPRRPGAAHAAQVKGAIASRMRRAMPPAYEIPAFEGESSILAFARELVRLALKEDVDLRRVDTAIRGAHLALAAFSAQTQAQILAVLLKMEHGGAASALLERLRVGPVDGSRRPLPGRVLPMTPTATAGDGA